MQSYYAYISVMSTVSFLLIESSGPCQWLLSIIKGFGSTAMPAIHFPNDGDSSLNYIGNISYINYLKEKKS